MLLSYYHSSSKVIVRPAFYSYKSLSRESIISKNNWQEEIPPYFMPLLVLNDDDIISPIFMYISS